MRQPSPNVQYLPIVTTVELGEGAADAPALPSALFGANLFKSPLMIAL